MKFVSTLPAVFLATSGALLLLGCSGSSKKQVSSVRSIPYYEVYDANGALVHWGSGAYPYWLNTPGNTLSGKSIPGIPDSPPPTRSALASAPAPASSVTPLATQPLSVPVVARSAPQRAPSSLLSEVKVRKQYISTSARGRRNSRSMSPRYITIHSTQNWSKGADAWRHSTALKNSKLGKLSWHFTTDENVAVQHLPTNITGNHADYDGPGNRYSIGIEMCEHPGNSRSATVERTAKLAAYLMDKYDIPLARVVPHYHWPRKGRSPAHKNCPHFLLDNGRPGAKWRGFQAKVKNYQDQITRSPATFVSR